MEKLDSDSELHKQLSLTECECRKLTEVREALESMMETLLAFTNKVVQSGKMLWKQ